MAARGTPRPIWSDADVVKLAFVTSWCTGDRSPRFNRWRRALAAFVVRPSSKERARLKRETQALNLLVYTRERKGA